MWSQEYLDLALTFLEEHVEDIMGEKMENFWGVLYDFSRAQHLTEDEMDSLGIHVVIIGMDPEVGLDIFNGSTSIPGGLFDSITPIPKPWILPQSITEIHPEAFHNCANLTISCTNPNFKRIYDSAFFGCENLDVTLPKVPGELSAFAFSNSTGTLRIPVNSAEDLKQYLERYLPELRDESGFFPKMDGTLRLAEFNGKIYSSINKQLLANVVDGEIEFTE